MTLPSPRPSGAGGSYYNVTVDNTPPDINDYQDYRTYLRDVVDHLRATDPAFSYRQFSRVAGFKSHTLLPMIIDGKRNLSPFTGRLIARALDLDEKDANRLQNLATAGLPVQIIDFDPLDDDAYRILFYVFQMKVMRKLPLPLPEVREQISERIGHDPGEGPYDDLIGLGLITCDEQGIVDISPGARLTQDTHPERLVLKHDLAREAGRPENIMMGHFYLTPDVLRDIEGQLMKLLIEAQERLESQGKKPERQCSVYWRVGVYDD